MSGGFKHEAVELVARVEPPEPEPPDPEPEVELVEVPEPESEEVSHPDPDVEPEGDVTPQTTETYVSDISCYQVATHIPTCS